MEPSTLDVANTLSKRCQSTILMVTATPKGSKGSLGRGERANLTNQGQPRAFRADVSMRYKTEIGPDHVLMGWMVRHCACVVNNFQVKGTRRTPYRSIRCKDYTGEVVPFGEICLNLKKRKIGEPDINPVMASSSTADTPKRRESEQGSSANESSLAGCVAAVNNLLCDVPTVDLSRDRTALSGKSPEDELKAGRELELQNMLNFDAFEVVDELPPRKHAYNMVWVDKWRGDRVRSRLCVRQFKAEGLRDDLFARTPDTFFHQIFVGKSSELQGLWNPCHRHFCCIHARSNT